MQAARQLSPEQEAVLNHTRKNMAKRMTCIIVFDMILLSLVMIVLLPRAEVTKACSSDLYWAGMAILVYALFFVMRNIFICALSYFSMNPANNSAISRLSFICIDCFAYTAILIWATYLLYESESTYCRDSAEDIKYYWWLCFGMCIFGYVQMFFEWLLCLIAGCVSCVFCCIYCCFRSEERAQALAQF